MLQTRATFASSRLACFSPKPARQAGVYCGRNGVIRQRQSNSKPVVLHLLIVGWTRVELSTPRSLAFSPPTSSDYCVLVTLSFQIAARNDIFYCRSHTNKMFNTVSTFFGAALLLEAAFCKTSGFASDRERFTIKLTPFVTRPEKPYKQCVAAASF